MPVGKPAGRDDQRQDFPCSKAPTVPFRRSPSPHAGHFAGCRAARSVPRATLPSLTWAGIQGIPFCTTRTPPGSGSPALTHCAREPPDTPGLSLLLTCHVPPGCGSSGGGPSVLPGVQPQCPLGQGHTETDSKCFPQEPRNRLGVRRPHRVQHPQ